MRREFGRVVAERTCSLCVFASTLVPTSCCSYPDTDGYEQPKEGRSRRGIEPGLHEWTGVSGGNRRQVYPRRSAAARRGHGGATPPFRLRRGCGACRPLLRFAEGRVLSCVDFGAGVGLAVSGSGVRSPSAPPFESAGLGDGPAPRILLFRGADSGRLATQRADAGRVARGLLTPSACAGSLGFAGLLLSLLTAAPAAALDGVPEPAPAGESVRPGARRFPRRTRAVARAAPPSRNHPREPAPVAPRVSVAGPARVRRGGRAARAMGRGGAPRAGVSLVPGESRPGGPLAQGAAPATSRTSSASSRGRGYPTISSTWPSSSRAPAGRLLARERPRHLAVHRVDGPALRARRPLGLGRAAQFRALHRRRARLPPRAPTAVRRVAARARRLQRRRDPRRPGDASPGRDELLQLALADETERYVFRALAAKMILSEPERHRFEVPHEQRYRPHDADVIVIDLRDRTAVAELGGKPARSTGSSRR